MFIVFSTRKSKFVLFLLFSVITPSIASAFQIGIPEKCGIDDPLLATDEQIACLDEPYSSWIIDLKNASPEKDAAAKMEEGEFKFLEIVHAWGGPTLPRIECFVNWPREQLHGSLFFSDAIDGQEDTYWRVWAEKYVTRFNQEMVSNPKFSYRDLCIKIEDEIQQNRIDNPKPNLTLEKWLARTLDVATDGTIMSAARLGKKDVVNAILTVNPESVHYRDIFGFSALEWSILRSNEELTKNLIVNGANVNGEEQHTITPLYLAIAIKNENLVRLLLDNGADPNSESGIVSNLRASNSEFYYIRIRPLSMAVQLGELGMVKALLASGAEVDGQSSSQAPIFLAIENYQFEVLRILLDAGADISVRDRNLIAPIQTAAERNNYPALKLLMDAGSSKLARSEYEAHLWESAYKTKRDDILTYLIAFGTNVNLATKSERRKLSTAIRRNKIEDVKLVITDVDQKFTHLKTAISEGDISLIQDTFQGRIRPLRNFAYTELAATLENSQTEIGIWLLENGANPDAKITPSNLEWLLPSSGVGKDSYGSATTSKNRKLRGPLMRDKAGRGLPSVVYALAFSFGPLELTKAVAVKSNMDITARSRKFSIALNSAFFGFRDHKDIEILDYALQFDDIDPSSPKADLFLSELCFWTIGENIDAFSYFIERGFLPNQTVPKNQTGVNWVRNENALNECIGRDAKAAIMLLEKGADPNQRSRTGEPALHSAIEGIGSYKEVFPYENVVKLLLEKGADPTATHVGRNALDIAQRRMRFRDGKNRERLEYVIQLLADYGLTESAQKVSKDDPYQGALQKFEQPIPVQ